jgi:hypothetical protein
MLAPGHPLMSRRGVRRGRRADPRDPVYAPDVMTATFEFGPPCRPFEDGELTAIADIINDAAPGRRLGRHRVPRQEGWVHRFRPILRAAVLIGVCAGFGFPAGALAQPTRSVKASTGSDAH